MPLPVLLSIHDYNAKEGMHSVYMGEEVPLLVFPVFLLTLRTSSHTMHRSSVLYLNGRFFSRSLHDLTYISVVSVAHKRQVSERRAALVAFLPEFLVSSWAFVFVVIFKCFWRACVFCGLSVFQVGNLRGAGGGPWD